MEFFEFLLDIGNLGLNFFRFYIDKILQIIQVFSANYELK